MDNVTDSNVSTGIGGPESNVGDNSGNASQSDRIAGAINPDAARNLGTENPSPDDFASSFAEAPRHTITGKRKYTKRAKQSEERQEAPLNINGIEKILFSAHGILSALTQVPELALDESEAKKLAKSIEGVTDQYKLTLDPKVAAYIDLGSTVSMIYGPRAFAFYLRKKQEAATPKPQAQQQRSDNVQDIRPATSPNRPQPLDPVVVVAAAFDPGRIINGA